MPGTALSDKIDYAILALVFRTIDEEYEAPWNEWERAIRTLVAGSVYRRDLLAALVRMWNGGMIQLAKPDGPTYSGLAADDDAFFFSGRFKAIGTVAGGACWDGFIFERAGHSNRKAASPFR
ncbi:MAG: hypothetical protein J0H49_34915 [Acidobacteria bacterium]|nr:hypothetical protein [Acidobacteriota bacterium]